MAGAAAARVAGAVEAAVLGRETWVAAVVLARCTRPRALRMLPVPARPRAGPAQPLMTPRTAAARAVLPARRAPRLPERTALDHRRGLVALQTDPRLPVPPVRSQPQAQATTAGTRIPCLAHPLRTPTTAAASSARTTRVAVAVLVAGAVGPAGAAVATYETRPGTATRDTLAGMAARAACTRPRPLRTPPVPARLQTRGAQPL
mmetsp:Transcript_4201/g.12159  ORF Transcript_4201/g.12159 Transcript_4201/m.12159 type:complete len:204 (+) Transcript_4201:330-941(+)